MIAAAKAKNAVFESRAIGILSQVSSKLNSLIGYAATLLHELGHATTGAPDVSRAFEHVLTEYLGKTSVLALQK
jgi:antirestriction protein ArdC